MPGALRARTAAALTAALALALPALAAPPAPASLAPGLRAELASVLDEEELLLGRAVAPGGWSRRLAATSDAELSEGWGELVRRRACGRLAPSAVSSSWHLPRAACPTEEQARRLLSAAGSARRALDSLDGSRPELHASWRALEELREIVERGGWPVVPEGELLERGVEEPRVEALRRRLAASGDLAASRAGGPRFDAELEQAVLRFQARHGLLVDGRAGRRTLAALNEPAAARLEQLRANVERMRSLPGWAEGEQLVVNVPEQVLSVWSEGRRLFRLRVVVGTRRHATPLFRERMTYLVFHPPWNVPGTLAARELLPKLRRDPEDFVRRGYEVLDRSDRFVPIEEIVLAGGESGGWSGTGGAGAREPLSAGSLLRGDYRFRQQPGAENALGLVKFMLPNRFNVYLHDTPATSLFEEPSRAFSHGCIRVQEPLRLAEHALAGNRPAWTLEEILRAMRSPTEEVVLERPLTVTILYWTAWADPQDGSLQLRDDVYRLDGPWTDALSRQERVSPSAGAR